MLKIINVTSSVAYKADECLFVQIILSDLVNLNDLKKMKALPFNKIFVNFLKQCKKL